MEYNLKKGAALLSETYNGVNYQFLFKDFIVNREETTVSMNLNLPQNNTGVFFDDLNSFEHHKSELFYFEIYDETIAKKFKQFFGLKQADVKLYYGKTLEFTFKAEFSYLDRRGLKINKVD